MNIKKNHKWNNKCTNENKKVQCVNCGIIKMMLGNQSGRNTDQLYYFENPKKIYSRSPGCNINNLKK